MFNEILDKLTGHHRRDHPNLFDLWWEADFDWQSARERWAATCREVGKSKRVEQLHAVRDDYLRTLRAYAIVCEGLLLLAPNITEYLPAKERLRTVWEDLLALQTELSTRWVTLDDLYSIVAEHLSQPAEREAQLAASSPPLQAWYDEDADPFTPAD